MAESKNNGNAPPIKASESVIYTKPGGLANLIMPHLREKIKEEMMSLQKDMDDLYCAAYHMSQGINALEVMAMGLSDAHDPYADGFHALYSYLSDANLELNKHLNACINAL